MRTTRRIDAGLAWSGDRSGQRTGKQGEGVAETTRYFFDCAGVGKLAVAAVAGQAFEKRHWGLLPGAVRKFFESKRQVLQVEIDGRVLAPSTSMVTISNAPIMGNKLLCAPGAKMDDGFLDVAVYDGLGNVALADHFRAAAAGNADALPCYRARKIRITSERALLSNADMEVTPEHHVLEISVVPGAVRVIVGNGPGLTAPVLAAPEAPAFADDPPLMTPALAEAQEGAVHDGAE